MPASWNVKEEVAPARPTFLISEALADVRPHLQIFGPYIPFHKGPLTRRHHHRLQCKWTNKAGFKLRCSETSTWRVNFFRPKPDYLMNGMLPSRTRLRAANAVNGRNVMPCR